jgi:hypothetical protein
MVSRACSVNEGVVMRDATTAEEGVLEPIPFETFTRHLPRAW